MQVSRGCGTLTLRSGWWGEEGAAPFVGFGSARWGWAVEAGLGAALPSPVLRARLERPRGVLGKGGRFRGNRRSATAGRGNSSSAFLPSGLPTTSAGRPAFSFRDRRARGWGGEAGCSALGTAAAQPAGPTRGGFDGSSRRARAAAIKHG